ncbi:hypothetical protein RF11_05489 [Thelohanellus kitauei]|uniref:Uncharacterized protein n=1 Tax=Thelohanellus kitauei TaxID=669202 RepID=A0A0C2IHC4_THEKT|nr:hypothetical protein RF11_05489 [Thelohanellus kitauei]
METFRLEPVCNMEVICSLLNECVSKFGFCDTTNRIGHGFSRLYRKKFRRSRTFRVREMRHLLVNLRVNSSKLRLAIRKYEYSLEMYEEFVKFIINQGTFEPADIVWIAYHGSIMESDQEELMALFTDLFFNYQIIKLIHHIRRPQTSSRMIISNS